MRIRGYVMSLFFFQAEDGIRDLVRSRGLGDVYKRQAQAFEGEWYKTGDMLRRDDKGYYYFSDRKKDAVLSLIHI